MKASSRVQSKIAALVLAVLVAVLGAPSPASALAPPNTLRNPLRMSTPDPQVTSAGGFYYLTYSQGAVISVARAASLTGLAAAPATVVWTGATDDPARCCDLWAPELHQVGDHWYVYYAADDGTASHHALQVLESADPLGPYHFKNTLTGGALSTDPTVLDQGGTHFLLWSKDLGDGTSGLAISAMSNAWTLTGTPTVISRPTNSWETVGQAVDEGPSVLQRDGKLFVTFAASSCGSADQALGMLSFTGTDVLSASAWTKSAGPVFARSDANWVFGPGQNSYFSSPDGSEVWNAYYAVTSPGGAAYGSCGADRSLRVQKVRWSANGTPLFGAPAASWQSQTLPAGDPGGAVVPTGFYRLTPQHDTGKALDVGGCSSADNAKVDTYAYNGGRCQQWFIDYQGDGSYTISDRNSGKALEVLNCASARNSTVDIYPYWGGDCQEWYLDPVGDGSYRITHRLTGQALDVLNCSTAAVPAVDIYPYWGAGLGTCQQWKLEPVT
ncbi:family 43 glycosylhydrolase [Fodinicola feengrottensis]|uniref:Family 43 glycosylhydrolase n=1 Tax=Fodinicola feengrottensis TaxID=435914 RepID=A0ABN2J0W5_9ACTN